ncbi:hypothetical protein MKX01_023011 [Papaver californicum]|nr:hypothetical protein MKX01_023011 [Papaver californicum]
MVLTSLILFPASTSSLFLPVSHSRLVNFRIQCCEDSLGRLNKKHINNENGLANFPEKFLVTPTTILPRPRRIILIRHGQSEENVDEERFFGINSFLRGPLSTQIIFYFYVSPYKRTLETLRGVGKAFESSRISGVREEPRLREQDFGRSLSNNFQNRERMRVEKAERILYGRFFFRFPNGESAADAPHKHNNIKIGRFQPPGQRNSNMNLVIVSHGLTLRVFLMRWYKWTVEQFEGLNNFGNGIELVMQTGLGGRYSLLVHHTHEELKDFGLTEEMLIDQEWQKIARPGELNYDCLTTGPSFFKHFDDTWKQQ